MWAFGQQDAGGHRHVVEDAEARAEVGVGVVAAAGGVAGEAVLERQAGGQHGAGHRAAGAQGQGLGHRQAEAPLLGGLEPLLQDGGDVARRVGELEPGAGGRLRHHDLLRQHEARLPQVGEEPPELRHREAVRLGQRRDVGRVVGDRDPHP